jgi:hypothetical protein
MMLSICLLLWTVCLLCYLCGAARLGMLRWMAASGFRVCCVHVQQVVRRENLQPKGADHQQKGSRRNIMLT